MSTQVIDITEPLVVETEAEELVLTANGARTLETSGHIFTDLFFLIGASRSNPDQVLPMVRAAAKVDPAMTYRILFWARDARGGAGEREVFRRALNAIINERTALPIINSGIIPELGRWDDILEIFKNEKLSDYTRQTAANVIKAAIEDGNGLAAKWMPRKGPVAVALRKAWGMSPKGYRVFLVSNTKVVETQMCAKEWKQITFNHVPSLAMTRYTKAFARNEPVGFTAYKAALVSGAVTAKTASLYPYNIFLQANVDATIANVQWRDYLAARPKLESRIIPIVDVSGSMGTSVGPCSAMEVAMSLGLYMAQHQKSSYSNKVMTFHTQPALVDLDPKAQMSDLRRKLRGLDWGGSTNLQAVFDLLLNDAVTRKLKADEMAEYIFIVSDMEFNVATGNGWSSSKDMTNYQAIEKKYAAAGYARPNIVFWNVCGRPGNVPVTYDQNGTALISGFSTEILNACVNGLEISPIEVMKSAVMKRRYSVRGVSI